MNPYDLSKSRWEARKNVLKGKKHRGVGCGCRCCRGNRFDRHHVRPRMAWELKEQYGLPGTLMKGSQGVWNASPRAFLDWFWDCEGVEEASRSGFVEGCGDCEGGEESWSEEWEEEESGDACGQGKDWGELSFAFGVGSGEYEMLRGEWTG